MKKLKTVRVSELTLLKMVAGGEKRHKIVIDTDGKLKEWVGFGWIDLRVATEHDRERWPRVVGKREGNVAGRIVSQKPPAKRGRK